MKINAIGAGPHPDISKSGVIVEIEGIEINTSERQRDSETIIDIRVDRSGVVGEGLVGEQIAMVVIPAGGWRVTKTDEVDALGNPEFARTCVELDPAMVSITLWPYTKKGSEL